MLRMLPQVERPLSWDMTGPCADCPFRRNAPEHEGVCAAIVGHLEAINNHRFAHTCHKTDPNADGPVNGSEAPPPLQHCGGAMHFLVRAGDGCDLQLPLLKAAEAGKLDLSELVKRAEADERVFASVRELVEYYLAMANRIMAARQADPLVYVYGDDVKPQQMKLSEAVAAKANVVSCVKCHEPAVEVDRLWPYHMEQTFCAKHGRDAIAATVAELEAAR